jgi:hypothetical protein
MNNTLSVRHSLAFPFSTDMRATTAVMRRRGVSLTVPGLYYVGRSGLRNFAWATLRGVGPDAVVVVRQLRRRIRTQQRAMVCREAAAGTNFC